MEKSCRNKYFFVYLVAIIIGFIIVIPFDEAVAQAAGLDPEEVFLRPPAAARPGVLWMWMGSNLSKAGITKDLESLKAAGFNRTTMFSLADITTPWAGEIKKSPTPELISWTEPWWDLVKYATGESKRLGMDFGMFNGPSYESSGGPWITAELSMQEICWSADTLNDQENTRKLKRPQVDPRANEMFPVYNPETNLVEKPIIEERKTYYKDIAVVAMPVAGVVQQNMVIDVTAYMLPDGTLQWKAPAGTWVVYRFGHTTMGTLIQPAQWKATGFECDKMSQVAVDFHIDHVIGEIQKHLGALVGNGFSHVHFDSYEAGVPTWTPNMKTAFASRRGYDLTRFLPVFAGRIIENKQETEKFAKDFDATIKDLYRDIYFKTIATKLKTAHLDFLCEPYGGPWRQEEILPLVQNVMTEFWTHGGKYSPYELEETVSALRKSGQNIVEAEAFTGDPSDSKWDETPEWLKPIGDEAFCAGVNRMVLHRFVQQPWNDKYQPGATMGRWGTHFDRTQTWWKPGRALFEYWKRCQALLQWGGIAEKKENDFSFNTKDSIRVKNIHRHQQTTDVYFVANTSRKPGLARCTFNVMGMQPELWDPVTAQMRTLAQFEQKDGMTSFDIQFDKAQSFFIVFRKKSAVQLHARPNFPLLKTITAIDGAWKVQFDSIWGGPARPLTMKKLQDWTTNEIKGVKYFSGTAVYTNHFRLSAAQRTQIKTNCYLDLGNVKHIASIKLNGKDLGVVWTAPWRIAIPAGLLQQDNYLNIEVTNVWANRLIGDEQEPADCEWLPAHLDNGKFLKEFPDWFLKNEQRPSPGRYCFTTWNYFSKDSKLISAGLLGPVQLMIEQ